ncbi:MAG: hypothetical protein ACJ04O_05780 [Cellvibrionales bacterium]|nr:hypothetical protein [Porticoccaceae bacterium]|tara:strand:+ start:1793 stop:2416 length:624 start_codon:yes stop_codon:yes gene_type:complete
MSQLGRRAAAGGMLLQLMAYLLTILALAVVVGVGAGRVDTLLVINRRAILKAENIALNSFTYTLDGGSLAVDLLAYRQGDDRFTSRLPTSLSQGASVRIDSIECLSESVDSTRGTDISKVCHATYLWQLGVTVEVDTLPNATIVRLLGGFELDALAGRCGMVKQSYAPPPSTESTAKCTPDTELSLDQQQHHHHPRPRPVLRWRYFL